MRFPTRRTFWLSTLLLLAAVVAIWLVAPRSRITQANYDRIKDDMSEAEVVAILGEPTYEYRGIIVGLTLTEPDIAKWEEGSPMCGSGNFWCDGPNQIIVGFVNGKVHAGELHLATVWETLTWYAKDSAKKIGIQLD